MSDPDPKKRRRLFSFGQEPHEAETAAPVEQAENPPAKRSLFSFGDPASRAEEPAAAVKAQGAEREAEPWYAGLLGKGAAILEGLTKGGQLALHAPPDLNDSATGEGIRTHRARMTTAGQEHPWARGLGELSTDVAAGALAPGTPAAQAIVGGATSAMGELGSGGDLARTIGAGLGGAGAGWLGGTVLNKLTGPARQTSAIRSALTRDSLEGETAIDRALGGQFTAGQGGKGFDYAVQRARELVPGQYPAPERLRAAANEALESARAGPLASLKMSAPRPYDMYEDALMDLASDPRGAGFMTTKVMKGLESARRQLLSSAPEAAPVVRQWTADSLFSGVPSGADKGIIATALDALMNSRNMFGAPVAAGWKLAKQAADQGAFSPTLRGALRAGTTGAEEIGSGMGATLGQAMAGDHPEEAYAGEKSTAFAISSVLSSPDTGLPDKERDSLTSDLLDGNRDKLAATLHRLSLQYPAFQAQIRHAYEAMNQD